MNLDSEKSPELFDIHPLLEAIRRKREEPKNTGSRSCVIAIDGPCASGKTTLAKQLAAATKADIVHMDDFFLPAALRTKERLREPGGNVHYERFMEEVIPALTQGGDFSYRCFDCGKMEMGPKKQVRGMGIVIVEGSYSCHPKFGNYMDIKVFIDVDPEEQMKRIVRREGPEAVEMFRQRWIPMEEVYLETYQIRDRADIFVWT